MNDDAIETMMPTIDSSARAWASPDEPHKRAPADPLGMRGLPEDREALDETLRDLCRRLIAAKGEFLGGGYLAGSMRLTDTRTLRLLVAYGRVHHRIREIVSMPGEGYCWGAFRPELYDAGAAQFRRMGLCYLFSAGLLRRKAPVVELAQLALDFVKQSRGPDQATTPFDEFDAWMAGEDISAGDVLDAMIKAFGATEDGRAALRYVGHKHASLLLPPETRRQLIDQLDGVRRQLVELLPAG